MKERKFHVFHRDAKILFNKESEERKAEGTRVDFNLVPKITPFHRKNSYFYRNYCLPSIPILR